MLLGGAHGSAFFRNPAARSGFSLLFCAPQLSRALRRHRFRCLTLTSRLGKFQLPLRTVLLRRKFDRCAMFGLRGAGQGVALGIDSRLQGRFRRTLGACKCFCRRRRS
jgi:hypothetical protein